MNILISSLGVGTKKEGGYKTASYKYNKKVIKSQFISKALTEFLDIDKLFLVGTNGSIWDSVYSEFGGNEAVENKLFERIGEKNLKLSDLEIINEQINKNLNSKGSKCFLIDYGLDETELWNNFSRYIEILNFIDEGDTVYLDITHSFRSLALMSFVMVEFGNLVKDKNFKVAGIFYGMLEARDEHGNTPIVDLKILYDLMQWIKAINSFKKYGNAYGISELLAEIDIDKKVKSTFDNFSDIFSIGNMAALQEFIKNSDSKIKLLKEIDNPIIKLISKDIFDFFDRFKKSSKHLYSFQFEISKWHYENKNYGLSYYGLTESFVSYQCKYKELNPLDYEDRQAIKKEIKRDREIPWEIRNIYKTSNHIRNNSAHYLNDRKDSYKNDIDTLKNYILKLENYMNEINKD